MPPWNRRSLGFRAAKRFLDLAVAVPCLVATLPVQGLIALILRLDSPGPAIFRQERLALGEGRFFLLKFRTMRVDARERFPHLYNYQEIVARAGNVPLKLREDPRLTRVGRVLRMTSLDELPNLWNVVRGDMSLVGPRPEIPELLPLYSAEHRGIFRVKPGITGLAQVQGRNRLTVAETVALDYLYARTMSFALDLAILVRTVRRVVTCRDAY